MTLTRSAPTGAGPRRAVRAAAGTLAVAALGAVAVSQRASFSASFAVLPHLHWLWIPAAIALETVSMAAFAFMLRRLLTTGGARVHIGPMLATAFAANAVSVSIPVAGPELATAFTFRRFMRHGADAPLAGWSLLAGGVISAAAGALVVVGGGLASGNGLVAGLAVPGGVLAVAGLLVLGAAARRPQLRAGLERPATWVLRHVTRLVRRPAADPGVIIRAWAERLGSLRLAPSGWATVTSLGLLNWLADAAVLVVSIRAAGGPVPWHDLLLVYGSGVAAQSLNITPGGLGVAEGTLSLALVAVGLRASQALAAVLLYRLASFWLVAIAGWLVFWCLRRREGGRPATALSGQQAEPAPQMYPSLASSAVRLSTQAGLRSHELVLLHGQPGSPADWQQVAGRLPAQLRAVAADRPGYGTSQLPAGGFAANARAVIDDLDTRGIDRAVLVGHSFGGGVAISAAGLAPERVEAVVLLASVGPGCANVWDRVLAAPGTGPLCALVVWKLTPWIARARLAAARRRAGRSLRAEEHVNWQVWGHKNAPSTLWRTFLTEQRALLRELGELERALPAIEVPVLVLADPRDTLVPVETARRLTQSLPDARLQLIDHAGHHLPRRAAGAVANAITAFLAAMDAEPPDSDRSAAGGLMPPVLVA